MRVPQRFKRNDVARETFTTQFTRPLPYIGANIEHEIDLIRRKKKLQPVMFECQQIEFSNVQTGMPGQSFYRSLE